MVELIIGGSVINGARLSRFHIRLSWIWGWVPGTFHIVIQVCKLVKTNFIWDFSLSFGRNQSSPGARRKRGRFRFATPHFCAAQAQFWAHQEWGGFRASDCDNQQTLNRKKQQFAVLAKKRNLPIKTANCCFLKAPKLPLMGPKLPLTEHKLSLTVSKLPLSIMAI